MLRRCLWIICHEEFGQHSAGALHGSALRLYHHAILGLPNTGRLQDARPLHFDHTHTTHGDRLEFGGVTEHRDRDPSAQGRVVQGGTGRHSNLVTVNDDSDCRGYGSIRHNNAFSVIATLSCVPVFSRRAAERVEDARSATTTAPGTGVSESRP